MRETLKKLILWALGNEYPKIIVQPVETVVVDGTAPFIDIRVPKKARR